MGSNLETLLRIFVLIGGATVGLTLLGLIVFCVIVPLFRGVGAVIGAVFKGIGWFCVHIFDFVTGMLRDVIRFIGALIAMIVLIPLVPLNIVFGRWSAAAHFADGVKRECHVGSACVYRAVIRRPLKLVLLDGLLEGLEQRVPEAMHGAPTSDKPGRRTGQYDGYTILGSLRAGGSGAKLYVAEPKPEKQRKFRHMPERVVIKSFALTEGSSLPQIVRESRALECAKQLGHVLDHGMDEHRFFYVMPYHPGDHLGILTRQFHGECGGRGLDRKRLNLVMSHTRDLLETLACYHKGGLWHKDVKPENVIVHDGRAHLVDLGLVTPLRSAMTLTTHGTEYFRDPEMVRQALRGVKVHQVDGAKFDIYATGAVLYFMLENTFPAHGGLSRITTNSPESLRWIVRRAMAEYNQRYATANEMLADLEYVMRGGDAFAVKPAELPSMRGGAEVALHHEPFEEPAVVGSVGAATAIPAAASVAVGAGTIGGGAAEVFGKPKIVVTNWWTGDYRVEQPNTQAATPAQGVDYRDFRRESFAFRDQMHGLRQQVASGTKSARKAAREQIKAARERARDIRTRALAHRHRIARDPKRVSPALLTIGIFVLSIVFLGLILVFSLSNNSRPRNVVLVNAAGLPDAGVPVVLVLDGADPDDPTIQPRLQQIIARQRSLGRHVIVEDKASHEHMRALVTAWEKDKNGPADEALEDALAGRHFAGLLQVEMKKRNGKWIKDPDNNLVWSTRPGAMERRRLPVPEVPAPPSLPVMAGVEHPTFLLINDHPAKNDPKVEARIVEIVSEYQNRGWPIRSDDEMEIRVRQFLPMGQIESAESLTPMLHATLLEEGLAGILRLDAAPGDGPAHERVRMTQINLDPSVCKDLAKTESDKAAAEAEMAKVESIEAEIEKEQHEFETATSKPAGNETF